MMKNKEIKWDQTYPSSSFSTAFSLSSSFGGSSTNTKIYLQQIQKVQTKTKIVFQRPDFPSISLPKYLKISFDFPSKIFKELRVEIQLFISNKQFDMKGARDHFKVMKMPNYKLERVRTILEYQCISNSISNHWTLQHSGSHIVWTIAFRFVRHSFQICSWRRKPLVSAGLFWSGF